MISPIFLDDVKKWTPSPGEIQNMLDVVKYTMRNVDDILIYGFFEMLFFEYVLHVKMNDKLMVINDVKQT